VNIGPFILDVNSGNDAEDSVGSIYLDICYFVYLPNFDQKTNSERKTHECVGIIIQDIEKNNNGLKNIEEY